MQYSGGYHQDIEHYEGDDGQQDVEEGVHPANIQGQVPGKEMWEKFVEMILKKGK